MADEKFDVCACIGAAYSEPYCYCEMKAKGLPLNLEARQAESIKLKEALKKLFGFSEGDFNGR